jgi:hypothetical protein
MSPRLAPLLGSFSRVIPVEGANERCRPNGFQPYLRQAGHCSMRREGIGVQWCG